MELTQGYVKEQDAAPTENQLFNRSIFLCICVSLLYSYYQLLLTLNVCNVTNIYVCIGNKE